MSSLFLVDIRPRLDDVDLVIQYSPFDVLLALVAERDLDLYRSLSEAAGLDVGEDAFFRTGTFIGGDLEIAVFVEGEGIFLLR